MSKVPITELPDELNQESRIAWHLDVPAVSCDPENLLLDVGQLDLYRRAVGLGGIAVLDYQGERSGYTVNSTTITGVNLDGSATGSASATKTSAEDQKNALLDLNGATITEYNRPIALVAINRPELASKIADKRLRNVSPEKAWAIELNSALTNGLQETAKNNLIGKFHDDRGIDFDNLITSSIMTVDYVCVGLSPTPAQVGLVAVYYGFVVGMRGLRAKMETGQNIAERRWSAFPGAIQPDRLALAALISKTKPFITAKKA